MKKLLISLCALLPLLCGCAGGSPNPEATSEYDIREARVGDYQFVESESQKEIYPLLQKYPNYKENSIAQEELAKELDAYFSQFIGEPFPFIEDFYIDFEEVDSTAGDLALVWFDTDPYMSPTFMFRLLVAMPKQQAATLKRGTYKVSGTLQKWDKKGRFTGTGFHIDSTIWLGTFYIYKATIYEQ